MHTAYRPKRATKPCYKCTVDATAPPHVYCALDCPGCRQTKLWIGWVCESAPEIVCPRCGGTPSDMTGLLLERTVCSTALGRAVTVDEEIGLTLWLQGFSNDVRWMLRMEYTRRCEGAIVNMVVGNDEGVEWATWVLDGHWLTKRVADGEFEEMMGYLPGRD